MRRIGFSSRKGGVGKTTLCGSCGRIFSESHRTVMVDLDPQASLTNWLLAEPPRWEAADVLLGKAPCAEALAPIRPTLSLLPTFAIGGELQAVADLTLIQRPFLLEDLCKQLEALGTEVVLFDLSPGMGVLERSALLALEEIVVPVLPEFFGLDAAETIRSDLDTIARDWRRSVRHRLLVVNQVNASFRRHRMVQQALEEKDYRVLAVPQDARLAEAQFAHLTVFDHDPAARSCTPIRELAAAMLEA